MSMSKNTVKYVLMVLGIMILLATYILVFTDYSDKTDALNTEIAALNNRLDQLGGYNANSSAYKNSIEENKLSINDTLGKYYSIDTPEDFIMFATALEDTYDLDINGLSFTEPAPVYSIMGIKDTNDYTIPLEAMPLTGYKISSTIDGLMNYSQMKSALDFVYSQKDVTTLDSLNMNFDSSTGLILGSFVINKYYITGRDIQEHQAVVPYTDIGKSILIGS